MEPIVVLFLGAVLREGRVWCVLLAVLQVDVVDVNCRDNVGELFREDVDEVQQQASELRGCIS